MIIEEGIAECKIFKRSIVVDFKKSTIVFAIANIEFKKFLFLKESTKY